MLRQIKTTDDNFDTIGFFIAKFVERCFLKEQMKMFKITLTLYLEREKLNHSYTCY